MTEAREGSVLHRRSFFDEQARRRRHARQWALATALPVAVFAFPLAIPLAPLLYLLAIAASQLVSLALPLPEAWWQGLHDFGTLVPRTWQQHYTGTEDLGDALALTPVVAALLLVAAPGFALLGVLWWAIRRRLLRDGPEAVLATLGARPPRPDDLEEVQLANVVEEMAIAAGAPRPRVVLLDDEHPNAAAVGTSPDDAVILVTRGALDRLDRDDTQALVGHALASVINGDLALGVSTLTVFHTRAVAMLLLNPSRWGQLARVAHWLVPGGREETSEAMARLLDEAAPLGDDLAAYLFLRPFPMTVLRARRYLADATAVQLTRQPDALAQLLRHLRGLPRVPGGELLEHLFVVGIDDNAAQAAAEAAPDPEPRAALPWLPEESEPPEGSQGRGEIQCPHPRLGRRLSRLVTLGAAPEAGDDEGVTPLPGWWEMVSHRGNLMGVLLLGTFLLVIAGAIVGMLLGALIASAGIATLLLWALSGLAG